ncbi:MAG: bifunctional methylenetetrahydrofolate dehydrogenase/methenyltetrahydrofolate cyclohydrolase FolD [Bacteroidota bacterium]
MLRIDGKQLAQDIKKELAEEVKNIKQQQQKVPHLAAVLVGNNPASESYVRNKVRSCEQVGFKSTLIRQSADISETDLLEVVDKLNNDDDIDGFIVQLPLPDHINEQNVTLAINPKKDVDGFHPMNFGRMAQGLPSYLPATPYGILQMLDRYNIKTSGKHCVVIGRSNIVGTPMSILLSRKAKVGNCTVTLAHSRTSNLKAETLRADIIIAAIGRANFLTADMVKEGAVIIDVGINRVDDASKKRGYRLVGDVDFEAVAEKAGYITPVPGGVGPMTVTSLMLNTLKAARKEIYE